MSAIHAGGHNAVTMRSQCAHHGLQSLISADYCRSSCGHHGLPFFWGGYWPLSRPLPFFVVAPCDLPATFSYASQRKIPPEGQGLGSP